MSTAIKYLGAFFLYMLVSTSGLATTWSAAYPYIQHIDGQNVTVKAFSFSPYGPSPTIGETKVYFKNKLLYTLDKYYRENIYTSADGRYLAIVHVSNSVGVSSYTFVGQPKLNFNQTAIELYKDGQLFKTFALNQVIDTSSLENNGRFFYWGYPFDREAYKIAGYGCDACKEVYGKRALKKYDSSVIEYNEWQKCNSECDSVEYGEIEMQLMQQSIYVRDNGLFILTNQNAVIQLDFKTMTIKRHPFQEIVSDKKTFKAPLLKRKYLHSKLPDKFDEPKLKDGRDFDIAIADLFSLKSLHGSDEKEHFCVFINNLVVNRLGKCIKFCGKVYDMSISDAFTEESYNNEMKVKLEEWISKQTFQAKLIPKKFNAYSFVCIVNLK